MADLVLQNFNDEDGAAVTFASAAGGGDKVKWADNVALMVKNDDASAKTVTLTPAFTDIVDERYGELTRSPIVLVVAAGAVAIIPRMSVAFRNASDADKVAITYSAVTSLKIAAFTLG